MISGVVRERPSGGDPAFEQPASQPPRVLLAFDWFWKYVAAQAVALRRAGAPVAMLHRTHLYEFAGRAEERDRLLAQVEAAGAQAFALPGSFTSMTGLRALPSLRRRVRDWHPDIVHAHDNCDPRLLTLARAPHCVVTVHDVSPHSGAGELYGLRKRVRESWIARADRVVVHGTALRDELAMTVSAERIAVVPHGTDVAAEPVPVPERPLVLLFGRLEAYKGVGLLADAMRLVWAERPDARLVVAGSGPEAARVPSDPRVELISGYVPETSLGELFARASVVVLPYLDGSQSGVGLQAVGRGIPVLVTDVGSLPELATEPSLVVPPADPQALAAGLLVALDHDLGLRRRTLEHARRNFSWEVVAERTLALYREVLDG